MRKYRNINRFDGKRRENGCFFSNGKSDEKEDTGQFQQTLNTFLNEFNIIYPSLMIALPENEVQRVNAHLSYLDEFRNVMLKTKGGQMQLGIIKGDLQKIFHTVKKMKLPPLSFGL